MRSKGPNFNRTASLKLMLRTLHYRNFRLFFVGQMISLIGTWMQQIAMSWLVYRLTNSSFLLGIVGFASQIPTFFLTPFAGVLIDRWNRHHILITTQTLAMVQALILAFLALTHAIRIWHVIVLGLFLGVINAIDIPARQAFLIDMIEKKEDLGNAIALNSSMVNVTRLLGPSIAGMLIALVGEGMCFLLNGLSYLAVIIALLTMRITPRKLEVEKPRILEGLAAGFTYAFGFAPIRSVLLLLALTSLMGMPYGVLLPVFATDILQGGPYTLGFLMTCSGIGALVGTVYLTLRRSILGLGRWIVIASSVFGIGLVGFSLSRTLWLSLIFISLAGFGMMVQMAATNTVLQTIVEDDKRGRVMSFYTVAFMGMTPFGSLLAGSLASKIGAPNTLIIGGICCILGSLVFASKLPALREMVRPIYVRLGIM